MKNAFIYLFVFLLGIGSSLAQDEGFLLELSHDTILSGNMLRISFKANNLTGQFDAPDLAGFNVVSGPNTSTSMSIVNGNVSQFSTYTYTILLEDIGEVIIPPAYFETSEGVFETEPRSIIVLPNPEGIIEEAPSQSGFFEFSFPDARQFQSPKKNEQQPTRSKKKKRKLKKI